MSRILFTWELGSNLGHLNRYLPIARLLQQRGHELLFAVKELDSCRDLLAKENIACVKAPHYCDQESAARELLNYADILAANGFGSPENLSTLIDGWTRVFAGFHPDIVVAQSAPSSILAAKLAAITVMRIDCGFGCPPVEKPFPLFRPWVKVTKEKLLQRDSVVLDNINLVCRKRGAQPFASLEEMFISATDILLTVPELDHYPGRQHGNYAGPIFNLDAGIRLNWAAGKTARTFVYLRPFAGLAAVLGTLAAGEFNVIAVIPGIAEELRTAFAGEHFQISSSPIELFHLLPQTDLAITHGGHGVASACLLNGVPMLLVPQMVEQLMTVYNFERLGIGIGVRHDLVVPDFAPGLMRILRDPFCKQNAARLAAKYAGYDQAALIRKLGVAIEGKTGAC